MPHHRPVSPDWQTFKSLWLHFLAQTDKNVGQFFKMEPNISYFFWILTWQFFGQPLNRHCATLYLNRLVTLPPTIRLHLIYFYKNGTTPASFCLFSVFSNKQYNFNNKSTWKNVMTIQFSNPRRLDHMLSHTTTRPGRQRWIQNRFYHLVSLSNWIGLIV